MWPCFFRLTLKVWYDQLFKGKHGSAVLTVISNVIAQTQIFYLLPSLTTQIILSVVEVQELNFNLTNHASVESL